MTEDMYNKLVTVDLCGTNCGLVLFYKNGFNANVLFIINSINDIEMVVQINKIFLSFVYGDPVQQFREHVWEHLTRTVSHDLTLGL